MGISVWGDRETTRDFPLPGYWVMPETGPGMMMISFSGSFHLVFGVTAFQRCHRPKPRPPVKTSFICWVTGLSLISRVPTLR